MKWSTDTCHGWNALLWPKVAGTYLEVIGCFGVALVVLLVGDMDFKIVDGFVMGLWTGFTLVVVNVNGLGVEQGRWENWWIQTSPSLWCQLLGLFLLRLKFFGTC